MIRRLDGDLDPTACHGGEAADSVGVGRESGPGGRAGNLGVLKLGGEHRNRLIMSSSRWTSGILLPPQLPIPGQIPQVGRK